MKRPFVQAFEKFVCLKQSGRLWNQNVIAFYKSIGFVQLNGDPSILIRRSEGETSIVSVYMYVDDFPLASNTMTILEALKKNLFKGIRHKRPLRSQDHHRVAKSVEMLQQKL